MSALLQGLPSPIFSRIGTEAPAYVHNGIPFEEDGAAALSEAPITHYHQGLPFDAVGRACVASTAVFRHGSGAAPFTADSRLAVTSLAATYFNSGVGYAPDGRLSGTLVAPDAAVWDTALWDAGEWA